MMRDFSDLCNTKLNNYILQKLLGNPNMAAVYLGKNVITGEVVAVKAFLPEAFGGKKARKRLFRFQREAILESRLRHPYIVPVLDYFEYENLSCIVMPYYVNGTLGDLIDKRGQISLVDTAHYIKQIASALDYAHDHNVIHRDIKPDNFLRDEQDHLLLSDFGIARIIGDPNWQTLTTNSDKFMGTLAYMSPEACDCEKVDWRTDIYALGIVIYEMLHGSVPFEENKAGLLIAHHQRDSLPSLHHQHSEIPGAVDHVLSQATAKRRESRFNSAQELAEAFCSSITSTSPYDAATEIDQDFFPNQLSARRRGALPDFPENRSARAFAPRARARAAAPPQASRVSFYRSGFWRKLKVGWRLLFGMLLVLLAIVFIIHFTQPSSVPTYVNITPQFTEVESNTQQALATVNSYYHAWNTGNYLAAYSLLSPDYQKNYPYMYENYAKVHYSCYTLGKPATLANGSIQVDVAANQILNNPSGSGTVIYEYTLSFIVQKIQGQWRLTAENVQRVSTQGTCVKP